MNLQSHKYSMSTAPDPNHHYLMSGFWNRCLTNAPLQSSQERSIPNLSQIMSLFWFPLSHGITTKVLARDTKTLWNLTTYYLPNCISYYPPLVYLTPVMLASWMFLQHTRDASALGSLLGYSFLLGPLFPVVITNSFHPLLHVLL